MRSPSAPSKRPRAFAHRAWYPLTAALLALSLGCRATGSTGDAGPTTLVVYAASSLTEAFQALARDFERAHPGVQVSLTLAGSQVLRLQIEQGAAADVFASADEEHTDALVAGGLLEPPKTFAHNALVVVVPPANPARLERFEHLDRARRVVVGTAEVPVGRYTRVLLEHAEARLGAPFVAAIRAHIVSEESNTRLIRAKVALGEADAAVVYRTDAMGTDTRVLPIPPDLNVRTSYPIATLTRAAAPDAAHAFIAYVMSPAGQRTLAGFGFETVAP